MSESKQALLSELSIDRGGAAAAASGRGGVPVWLTLLLVLVAGGGGAAVVAWLTQDAAPVAVRLAEVRRVSAGGEGAATVAESRERTVLDATGYITARRQATVSSEVTGRVIEVLIEEGMVVEQGQLLARLDDSLLAAGVALAEAQLEASRASLDETLAQLREAERSLERVRDLQGRDLASEQELDAAIAAQETFSARLARQRQDIMVAERALDVQRRQLEDFTIVAPFAGVVIDKAAQAGEMVSPISAGGGFTRTGICTIVDMDSLEIEVDVNEAYIDRVRPVSRW
jgi:HlyD family secretion protein